MAHGINPNIERPATELKKVRELYEFLQGEIPEGIRVTRGHMPKLSQKQAFTVIWYLQEAMGIVSDRIERCSVCGKLFHTWQEGIYWESKHKHFCGACEWQVPENYDRGKR